MQKTRGNVLRRRSWLVFPWIAIVGLGVGMLLAVFKVSSVNGFRTGWQGIPVYLALAGISGRVANCKVDLREDVILVVNLVRTHVLPRTAIRGVSVGDDGTLEVHLDHEREIAVFAFGGSVIDRFRGTSSEAEWKIRTWLNSDVSVRESEDAGGPHVRWTRCTSADLALLLCAVISGMGAIWMALSGS
ncbi:PH domain-containing protein [Streptomyces sp. NPDC091292]|uniref:PH domain-containing protein n=1 Tax=Streptomyces sp. NPDC091292 TaxID=3365991 RepID=UPI00382F06CC